MVAAAWFSAASTAYWVIGPLIEQVVDADVEWFVFRTCHTGHVQFLIRPSQIFAGTVAYRLEDMTRRFFVIRTWGGSLTCFWTSSRSCRRGAVIARSVGGCHKPDDRG